MKIDIGCGLRKKAGFVGIDIIDLSDEYSDKDFIQCNILDGIPLPDNSVSEVYSNRFFEHIPWCYGNQKLERPYDPLFFVMSEIHRVCRDKAKVELILPQNPEEFPVHTRRYGIYSFEMFCKVQTFESIPEQFRQIQAKFIFNKGLNPMNYLGWLCNTRLRDIIVKSFLRYWFVPHEIRFVLEVVK